MGRVCAPDPSAAEGAKSQAPRGGDLEHALRTPLTAVHGALGLLGAGLAGELSPDALALVLLALRNCLDLEAAVEAHLREVLSTEAQGRLNREATFG